MTEASLADFLASIVSIIDPDSSPRAIVVEPKSPMGPLSPLSAVDVTRDSRSAVEMARKGRSAVEIARQDSRDSDILSKGLQSSRDDDEEVGSRGPKSRFGFGLELYRKSLEDIQARDGGDDDQNQDLNEILQLRSIVSIDESKNKIFQVPSREDVNLSYRQEEMRMKEKAKEKELDKKHTDLLKHQEEEKKHRETEILNNARQLDAEMYHQEIESQTLAKQKQEEEIIAEELQVQKLLQQKQEQGYLAQEMEKAQKLARQKQEEDERKDNNDVAHKLAQQKEEEEKKAREVETKKQDMEMAIIDGEANKRANKTAETAFMKALQMKAKRGLAVQADSVKENAKVEFFSPKSLASPTSDYSNGVLSMSRTIAKASMHTKLRKVQSIGPGPPNEETSLLKDVTESTREVAGVKNVTKSTREISKKSPFEDSPKRKLEVLPKTGEPLKAKDFATPKFDTKPIPKYIPKKEELHPSNSFGVAATKSNKGKISCTDDVSTVSSTSPIKKAEVVFSMDKVGIKTKKQMTHPTPETLADSSIVETKAGVSVKRLAENFSTVKTEQSPKYTASTDKISDDYDILFDTTEKRKLSHKAFVMEPHKASVKEEPTVSLKNAPKFEEPAKPKHLSEEGAMEIQAPITPQGTLSAADKEETGVSSPVKPPVKENEFEVTFDDAASYASSFAERLSVTNESTRLFVEQARELRKRKKAADLAKKIKEGEALRKAKLREKQMKEIMDIKRREAAQIRELAHNDHTEDDVLSRNAFSVCSVDDSFYDAKVEGVYNGAAVDLELARERLRATEPIRKPKTPDDDIETKEPKKEYKLQSSLPTKPKAFSNSTSKASRVTPQASRVPRKVSSIAPMATTPLTPAVGELTATDAASVRTRQTTVTDKKKPEKKNWKKLFKGVHKILR